MLKQLLIGSCVLALAGCSAGSNIVQSSEGAVTVKAYGGNFGDNGAKLAESHCAKYGKVAVPEGSSGIYVAGKFTYLCK